ncbi:MAG: AI-2E family transporter [Kiritimatiellia bacterium]
MTRVTQWLVNCAALGVVVLALKAASPMITQVLVILFLAIIISPIYYLLRRWRTPSWLALALMIATMVLLCLYGMNVVSKAALDFTKKIPDYYRALVDSAKGLREWLHVQGVDVSPVLFEELLQVDANTISGVVKQGGAIIGNFLKNAVFVLIIVSFILCELPMLGTKMRRQRWMTDSLWERLTTIVLHVRHYMGIKTLISAATGFCIYLGLLLMDVDSPVLMGFVAFILNYVPVIGSIIAAIPAVLIALMQHGTLKGAYVAALYLAVNMLFGNILEPRFMGYGFGVSPVVVLFSLIFWGWVLGPLGTLFAVPLTMAMQVALGSMMREFDAQPSE